MVLTVIFAAWLLLAAAALWLLSRIEVVVIQDGPGGDPDGPAVADFRQAFSRWDHGGRPG